MSGHHGHIGRSHHVFYLPCLLCIVCIPEFVSQSSVFQASAMFLLLLYKVHYYSMPSFSNDLICSCYSAGTSPLYSNKGPHFCSCLAGTPQEFPKEGGHDLLVPEQAVPQHVLLDRAGAGGGGATEAFSSLRNNIISCLKIVCTSKKAGAGAGVGGVAGAAGDPLCAGLAPRGGNVTLLSTAGQGFFLAGSVLDWSVLLVPRTWQPFLQTSFGQVFVFTEL